MLKRVCAGGVVFYKDEVFILRNDKGEWVLPKGVVRDGKLPSEVALNRVEAETGVKAKMVFVVGETCYEFYSYSRQKPVCNEVTWYLMEAEDENYRVARGEGFVDGGFYFIDKAVDMITYSQDKSIVRLAYKKYLQSKGVVFLRDYQNSNKHKNNKNKMQTLLYKH